MRIRIDDSQTKRLLNQLDDIVEDSWKSAGRKFREVTPVRTGNARNNTYQRGEVIAGDYAYAARLDEGWSKQAPNGMVEPTVEHFVDELNAKVGRL